MLSVIWQLHNSLNHAVAQLSTVFVGRQLQFRPELELSTAINVTEKVLH